MRRRLIFVSLATVVAACGSRTGLLGPTEQLDAAILPDAGVEAAVIDVSIPEDTLPPIDVSRPVDVVNDCPDAGSTLIYVITVQNELMSFYPPTAAFRTIGTLVCPADPGDTPLSMAVDRTGIAYVLYNGGELFRVSTANASCTPTPFRRNHVGFTPTFGMGFSSNVADGGETLFVASDNESTTDPPSSLGSVDVNAFTLNVIGAFNPSINEAELTGTGAGDLFAFYPDPNDANSTQIGQLDKQTATVVGQSTLTNVSTGRGWAFAFWGGDFYTFTAPGPDPQFNPTIVTRYRPSDGSVIPVAKMADEVVGAGVSTCAPQR